MRSDKERQIFPATKPSAYKLFRIAAIGELLWDILPGGPQLGGAPANFASLAADLSPIDPTAAANQVFLISRVGSDALGRCALDQLQGHHVISDFVFVDPDHKTGSVHVFNGDQAPVYEIVENVAWDFLPGTPSLTALAPTLNAVCFGTLAQRSPGTRHTLRQFVEATNTECLRVFDVNLRAPYWDLETLVWGCERATILKMNEEEAFTLLRAIGSSVQEKSIIGIAHRLLRQFPMEIVAITRAAKGCLLVTRETEYDHPGHVVDVVDSIGAGDGFAAALTYAVLNQWPLPASARFANYWGGWVATRRGGMPMPDEAARRHSMLAI